MELYPDGGELIWRRKFPGLPEQTRRAREFVAFLLDDLPGLDDAVLVTSEFVTNALLHTESAHPGGQFVLEVRRWADGAAIALTDQGGTKEPTISGLDRYSEHGRGLRTVQSLATEWAWTGTPVGRTFSAVFKAAAATRSQER